MTDDLVNAVVAAFRAEGLKGSDKLIERYARVAVETCERDTVRALKDLRGVAYRHVHRDDAVIISGAEYLRKSRLADQVEFSESVMADDERRAEIEAVARALAGDDQGPWYAFEEDAEKAIAALDRVRDARGDDEVLPVMDRDWQAKMAARSPQGEDHEARGVIEALAAIVRRGYHDVDSTGRFHVEAECRTCAALAASDAYLSRVAPVRDGTVAVEDVAEWLRGKARAATGRLDSSPRFTLLALVGAFLAEFSPASTGDRG